jgi:acetyl-CoA C-acetyltransferase
MNLNEKACIAGIYEHPTRHAPEKSLAQLHAEVAKGALDDAGLTKNDVDGYFCAGDVPGWEMSGTGPFSIIDYMGLRLRYVDTTESWGTPRRRSRPAPARSTRSA